MQLYIFSAVKDKNKKLVMNIKKFIEHYGPKSNAWSTWFPFLWKPTIRLPKRRQVLIIFSSDPM